MARFHNSTLCHSKGYLREQSWRKKGGNKRARGLRGSRYPEAGFGASGYSGDTMMFGGEQ
jgi:hypothetical protein